MAVGRFGAQVAPPGPCRSRKHERVAATMSSPMARICGGQFVEPPVQAAADFGVVDGDPEHVLTFLQLLVWASCRRAHNPKPSRTLRPGTHQEPINMHGVIRSSVRPPLPAPSRCDRAAGRCQISFSPRRLA